MDFKPAHLADEENSFVQNENYPCSGFVKFLTAHPYISVAVLCLMCTILTTSTSFGSMYTVLALIPMLVILFAGVPTGIYFSSKYAISAESRKKMAMFMSLAVFVCAVVFFLAITMNGNMAVHIMNYALCVAAVLLIYLAFTGKLSDKAFVLIIFALGFAVRLAYVLYTDISVRQHDVGNFDMEIGHCGYIRYIYQNFNLPDFDVRNYWQFYHPPFHHIIAALWMRVQTTLGINYYVAGENVQILTLFYSSICMVLSYKIFRQLGLKGIGLVCAVAIVAFCPTFYIMAGSVNNDILSIAFMLAAILNTLYWYKNPTFPRIMAVSLCVGLGMMTKLSVWMVAPAIAFVFIYVFIKNIKDFKKYLVQFVCFGVVCAPLALWWQVRNLLKFGVPLTYVPALSIESDQYLGYLPDTQRLFDFSFSQFSNVGDQFVTYGASYNEYNPIVALFKTSMFDELINTTNYPNIAVFNVILFWSAVIIGIFGFAAMIFAFCKRKNSVLNNVQKIFLALIYVVFFVSYYMFCFQFPFVCTENIRYAVPLIILGAFFTGLAVQYLGKNTNNKYKFIAKAAIYTLTAVFSISSVLVYYIVGM